MARVTYFVAVAFGRNENGDIEAIGEGVQTQSSEAARRTASRFQAQHGGGIAFSRTGDPNTGDFDEAIVLARYGDVATTLD